VELPLKATVHPLSCEGQSFAIIIILTVHWFAELEGPFRELKAQLGDRSSGTI